MAVNKLKKFGENIYILGTNHLAHSSGRMVEQVISEIEPDVVMIEIDEERLKLLRERKNQPSELAETARKTRFDQKKGKQDEMNEKNKKNTKNETGRKSEVRYPESLFDNTAPGTLTIMDYETDFPLPAEMMQKNHTASLDKTEEDSSSGQLPHNDFFSMFEQIQSQFGQILQIIPGLELLAAVEIVQKKKIPLKCIDLSMSQIIQRLSTLESNMRQNTESDTIIKALKEEEIPNSQAELEDLFTLLEDETQLENLISQFSKEFPGLFRALIEDRNEHMVEQIHSYRQFNPKHRILVVCGAFHVPGILKILETHA